MPILLFFLFCLSSMAWSEERTLVLNTFNEQTLPGHFRIVSHLRASGSGQFSEGGLERLLNTIPSRNIVFVDLRQESHGFLNGMSVSWFAPKNWSNIGLDVSAIAQDEKNRLAALLPLEEVIVHHVRSKGKGGVIEKAYPLSVVPYEVLTEAELLEKKGLRYLRLPVLDHRPPSHETIDAWLHFARQLPEETWLHFHCASGKGRTTLFLVLWDMMHHAKTLSFEGLVKRNHATGGIDLTHIPPLGKRDWDREYLIQRFEFLKEFYIYCHEQEDFTLAWTKWLGRKSL